MLGTLPSGWDIVSFESVLLGGTRNGIYKPKLHHGSGAKIVNMGELFAHRRLHAIAMKRLRVTQDELERFELHQGDLLFARRSLVAEGAGKCTLVCEVDEPTVFESSIIRARPDPEIADSAFLFYLFSSPYGSHAMGAITRQVAVAGITGRDLAALSIPLPPLTVQRRIAGILGAIDDKIELNRRMNLTLESIACAVFKSWFIDFDPVRKKMEGGEVGLPPDLAALFSQDMWATALGPIPVGWDVERCSSQFSLTMGQSPPGESYNEAGEGLPFYQGRRDFGSRYPTRRVYCDSPTRLAELGDTLVSVRAPVGDINMATEPCCIGRGVAAVRHYSGAITYTFETMNALGPQFADFQASGTVFGSVSGKDFAGLMVIAPPRPLVAAYEQEVRPIERLIKSQHETCGSVIELRDALLPRLMAGVT